MLSVLASDAFGGNVPGGHFVGNFDLNEDGQVSLQEVTEKRADIFYMFDQDENGTLDDAETRCLTKPAPLITKVRKKAGALLMRFEPDDIDGKLRLPLPPPTCHI